MFEPLQKLLNLDIFLEMAKLFLMFEMQRVHRPCQSTLSANRECKTLIKKLMKDMIKNMGDLDDKTKAELMKQIL